MFHDRLHRQYFTLHTRHHRPRENKSNLHNLYRFWSSCENSHSAKVIFPRSPSLFNDVWSNDKYLASIGTWNVCKNYNSNFQKKILLILFICNGRFWETGGGRIDELENDRNDPPSHGTRHGIQYSCALLFFSHEPTATFDQRTKAAWRTSRENSG